MGPDVLRLLRAVWSVGGTGRDSHGNSHDLSGEGSYGLQQLTAPGNLEGSGAEWRSFWGQRFSWGGCSRPSLSTGPWATGFAGEEVPSRVGTRTGWQPRCLSRVTLETSERVGEAKSAKESPQRFQADSESPVFSAVGQIAPGAWLKSWPSGGAQKSGGSRRGLALLRGVPVHLQIAQCGAQPQAESLCWHCL